MRKIQFEVNQWTSKSVQGALYESLLKQLGSARWNWHLESASDVVVTRVWVQLSAQCNAMLKCLILNLKALEKSRGQFSALK